jgi:hypothetical protein
MIRIGLLAILLMGGCSSAPCHVDAAADLAVHCNQVGDPCCCDLVDGGACMCAGAVTCAFVTGDSGVEALLCQ